MGAERFLIEFSMVTVRISFACPVASRIVTINTSLVTFNTSFISSRIVSVNTSFAI